MTSALGAGMLSVTCSVGVAIRSYGGGNPLVEGAALSRGRRLGRIVDLPLTGCSNPSYCLGFCLVGWSGTVLLPDAYAWAQTGTWTTEAAWVLVELVSGSKLEAWLVTPQTWLGLHPIASWALDIPLWLGLLFAGLFSTWLAILFGEN